MRFIHRCLSILAAAVLLSAAPSFAVPKRTGAHPQPPRPAGKREAAPASRSAKPASGSKGAARKPTAPAPKPPVRPAPPPDPSFAFFQDGVVPNLHIRVSDSGMQSLRSAPREYVACSVTEDKKTTFEQVGIHLKGAAGSFRGVDDRPALTLNFDRFKDGQRFHGLDKIHLNNSVQDPTYLHELICSELFLAAGVPTPRTTHARVWLNDRDLGVYVLKEGFNRNFLRRHFKRDNGNLYEGGFLQDLDGSSRRQSGDGPDDASDIRAVIDACRDADPARRKERLAALVDIDRLLAFAAMESLTCHWDGYRHNRNNYRFYFDPDGGRLHFFPHGMDQMFGDPNFPVVDAPSSLVIQSVLGIPEWKQRYLDRLAALAKLISPPDRLLTRVDAHHRRLRPVFAALGGPQAEWFDQHVRNLKERIQARSVVLARQIPGLAPAVAGAAGRPTGWQPRQETADARLERRAVPGRDAASELLIIAAGPSGRCVASWRTRVTLSPGEYRFAARVRARGVVALTEGPGAAAGVRISGSARTNRLEGDANWTVLTHQFRVDPSQPSVELVAELRATAGEVIFDAGAFRLQRLGD